MVDFIKRKVFSLTLGEKLKKIREKSGISLAEIASHIKVKQDYLEKIEEGDFEKLPFDVYVKGFLRNYARYLGLDPIKVINQFNKEVGIRENVKKYQRKDLGSFNFKVPSLTITPKIASIFISGLIILTGFVYFYLEVDHFSKKPNLIIELPNSNETVKSSSIEIIGFTDFENKIVINNEPVSIDSDGRFKETVGLQKGSNEITIEAFNKFEKNTKKIINIFADYNLDVLGAKKDQDEDSKEKSFMVEIEIRDNPSELLIKIDDKEIQKSILNPGISLKIKVEDKIKISSGKANNTYVKINEGDFFPLDEKAIGFKEVILNKEGIVEDEREKIKTNKN